MSEATPPPFDLATVDRLLSTTRAVRNRLDLTRPVERDVVLDCIRLSQQAPTGSNRQSWRWVVVEDAEKRRAIAEIYQRGIPMLKKLRDRAEAGQTRRVYDSAVALAERFGEIPVFAIPCVTQRPGNEFVPAVFATLYASIYPAVWSFQLALRSRGLGSVLTTLHLQWEGEVAALLGIPERVLQAGLIPVAYTLGTEFKPAQRPGPETITAFDGWSPELG
jgi:nitroreductase